MTTTSLLAVVGLVHLILFLFTTTYVLFFPTIRPILDVLFILYFILVNIHWIFLKGECIVAYLYKKYNDPSYNAGSDPVDVADISTLLQDYWSPTVTSVLLAVLLLAYAANVAVVFGRNGMPGYLTAIAVTSFLVYILLLRVPLSPGPDDEKKQRLVDVYAWLHLTIFVCVLVVYVRLLMGARRNQKQKTLRSS
jgi:hypothetical protein